MPQSPTPSFWALWAGSLAYGAWGGWQLPVSLPGQAFPTGALGVALAILPGVAFTIAGLIRPTWKSVPYPSLQSSADKILGQGTYEYMFLSAGLALLLGTGAVLAGCLGLARTLALGAGVSPLLTSVFFLSAGLGMLLAFMAQVRRKRSLTQGT